MLNLTRFSFITAALAAVIFAAVALACAPIASAQTMGEYGLAVGHAAAAGGSAPSIGSSSTFGDVGHAVRSSGASSSRTVVIPDDEARPPRDVRTKRNRSDSDDSAGYWTQAR